MKVAVGISGGIDSATAAYLLKKEGHEVIGVTMKGHDVFADLEDARSVCEYLGIPHHVIDLRDEFKEMVSKPFSEFYLEGKTPNPCIICNRKIKYGLFMDRALQLGADMFATGHYARVANDNGTYRLLKAKSSEKDQAYVLHVLTQEKLSKLILPLGEFNNKDEIRKIASEAGIKVADKKDSLGICFISENHYAEYIAKEYPEKVLPGKYILSDGTEMGTHPGIIYHTIGQKRNLFTKEKTGLSVIKLDAREHTVTLGSEEELYHRGFTLTDVTFTREVPEPPLEINIRMFQWGYEMPATLKKNGEGYKVVFDKKERAIARGQHAVFYTGDEVIGGGRIDEISEDA